MNELVRPPKTMLEVYNCLPEGTPVQLINNQLIMSPVPRDNHQQILIDLAFEITDCVKKRKLGKTRVAPSDVFLNNENIYQPNIYFISNEKITGFQEDGFHGSPDLVVEILSPGSEKLDRTDKYRNYERSGVKEYWIVDPNNKKVSGYQNHEGKFNPLPDETGKITSLLLNEVFNF